MNRGSMIYWRYKSKGGAWRFGFVAEFLPGGLVRLGNYNGDYNHGAIVSEDEVEYKPYR